MRPSLWIQSGLFVSGLIVSIACTALLVLYVRGAARTYGWVDQPNGRSVHRRPIPRLGGVAIVGGFLFGLLYFATLHRIFPQLDWVIALPDAWILAGALVMFILGLADDITGLGALPKLAVESLVAVMVILAGFQFELPFFTSGPFESLGKALSLALTFLWIIGVINAVNLIDGMDGLAAGIGVTAISSLTVALALSGEGPDLALASAFIGALLGFLLFNFHPASIFMGDSGSLFLGFILATFSLPATHLTTDGLTFLVPILALGLPVMDTATAILRRALQRRNIFSPDRDHIHHRLLSTMGQEQRSTVCILYGLNTLFGLLAILVLSMKSIAATALMLSLVGLLALFFLHRLGYPGQQARPKACPTESEPHSGLNQ